MHADLDMVEWQRIVLKWLNYFIICMHLQLYVERHEYIKWFNCMHIQQLLNDMSYIQWFSYYIKYMLAYMDEFNYQIHADIYCQNDEYYNKWFNYMHADVDSYSRATRIIML